MIDGKDPLFGAVEGGGARIDPVVISILTVLVVAVVRCGQFEVEGRLGHLLVIVATVVADDGEAVLFRLWR